jgi:hypothetical protein
MAIENQPIAPNSLNADKPKSVEEDELLQVIEGVQQSGEGGFIIQDDGSAVLDTGQPDMVQSDFNQNLAELIEESELMNISNQLIDGIEKDFIRRSRNHFSSTSLQRVVTSRRSCKNSSGGSIRFHHRRTSTTSQRIYELSNSSCHGRV